MSRTARFGWHRRCNRPALCAEAPHCGKSQPAIRPRCSTHESRGMDLDPQIADIIEALDAGFPRVETMTGAQARGVIRSRFVAPAKAEAVHAVYDECVPGPAGDIVVRVYRPAVADTEALPIL